MTITIVGAGALGSHVVMLLRNETVEIRSVDFDRVESKNTKAQFHMLGGVGRNKAVALSQAMQFSFGRSVKTNPHRLTLENVGEILGGSDLVVDCVDNGGTRRLIQEYARAHAVPCVHGALAADGMFGRVMWADRFVVDDEVQGAPTCENGEVLPFIVLTASCLALAVQAFLRKRQELSFAIGPTRVEKI